jgi:nucleoside-diphosphate-sugar epimerase
MRVLVTGGGGFLGLAICRLLCARGDHVVSLSRQRYAELEILGVQQKQGDIACLDDVLAASYGTQAIIHTAALAGAWGSFETYHATNVIGTENVIVACATQGIHKLVYTSTPSVVHAGHDLEGVNESTPYASHFKAHYPHTKAMAEQRVLAANSSSLATVALRPHLIWGPGDHHLLPRLIARAKAGRLRMVGKTSKLIDVVYIDNAAQAHLNALDCLEPGAPGSGRAYFISQGEPVRLDEMINRMLHACGLPTEHRRLPFALAYALGAVLERSYAWLRLSGEPPMTRFIAEQLGTAHWYDISAARRDLNYKPEVSLDEGMRRLSAWWRVNCAHES